MTPSGKMSDGNNGDNYSYIYVSQANGRIWPGAAATLTFTAQPTINTKTNTPIYNLCVASAATPPCALSTAASPSTTVKVQARDTFGNNAGPGSPGADATHNPAITITVKNGSAAGATLGSAPTLNGTADLKDQMKIVATGGAQLYASTTSGTVTTVPNATSAPFTIVNDLESCTANKCRNAAPNTVSDKQSAYGQVVPTTNQSFGGANPVTLTTQFMTADYGRCSDSNAKGVGQTTEIKTEGSGVTATKPNFTMVLVYSKDTIKNAGYTSRGPDAYNICLGAKRLDGGTGGFITKVSLNNAARSTALVDGNGVYWGWLQNCSSLTVAERANNPCITMRTKQVSALKAAVVPSVMSQADFDKLGMKDADVAIVISKPWPFDGKPGLK